MLQPFNHSIFLELARDLFSILRVHRGNLKFTILTNFVKIQSPLRPRPRNSSNSVNFMFPLCIRKTEKRSLAGRKNMLWLKGWSVIIFMQQKNIVSERSILKAFWDLKHGIFVCFKRFYTVGERVPVRCRSPFRNCILLTNSLIF